MISVAVNEAKKRTSDVRIRSAFSPYNNGRKAGEVDDASVEEGGMGCDH